MRPVTSFEHQVYEALKCIPEGKVTTYGELARYLNNPRGSRAVGGALNRNPFAPKVPCHRVVGSTGAITGYAYGSRKKIELLESEGVRVVQGKVDLEKFGFVFS